jgi:hypothetical protein
MGFRKLSARPRHHANDEEIVEETAAKEASGKPIEVGFQML